MRFLMAFVLSSVLMFGCGDGEEGIAGGNTLIRVDAPIPHDFVPVSMGIRISCDGTWVVPEQDTGEFDFETELELTSGDGSAAFWDGVFDLPLGECAFTLGLSCADEIVCIGSQGITIRKGDNYEDVVLVCPLSIGAFDACRDEPSCPGPPLLSQEDCRARPLDACDVDDVPEGWSHPTEPISLNVCDDGVRRYP